ncbi:hypothetical protein CAOG_00690 [Capsaspora owczarzaki ATCC 30864]|uniref:Phosducin domain-containing protein n=1 Tax=Capsaspora owczarzaki (strain ATCC 30864) TaxID=595528 RepID=A0A0D2WHP4_CAPO3|nr:hypothetical protein CAOG_00690 [Capsaspora owczarzaki ATCC 30864]KJE89160.1 hypothetical protein CAOG_000690 [Capsaspora owczarzaki ATCC 30864]|eukprot:XP_004365561.1 hypothetical protein CAOG_00690 [Capsaspora owczarzaki ATCC 30864]
MSALEDALLDQIDGAMDGDPDAESRRGGLPDDECDDDRCCKGNGDDAPGFIPASQAHERTPFERMPTPFQKATGPKGVLADYGKYKEYLKEEAMIEAAKRKELMSRLAMTGRTLDSSGHNEEELDEDDLLADDEFMKSYAEKRVLELKQQQLGRPKFGFIREVNAAQYVDAIDKEDKGVNVVIHLYDAYSTPCHVLNQILGLLAKQHPYVKFLKAVARSLSDKFTIDTLPTILVYKGGELVGNFVRLTDRLGDEFVFADVEEFLSVERIIVRELAVPVDESSKRSVSTGFSTSRLQRGTVGRANDDDDDDDE